MASVGEQSDRQLLPRGARVRPSSRPGCRCPVRRRSRAGSCWALLGGGSARC